MTITANYPMPLRQVTEEEFFAAIKADPRDIMPSIVEGKHPYASEWRKVKESSRGLWGVSNHEGYWIVATA